MKIGQYCQRQRCKHVELEQFLALFRVARVVSNSWAFLLIIIIIMSPTTPCKSRHYNLVSQRRLNAFSVLMLQLQQYFGL